jgi:predicted nucleic acid-binding protein
LRARAFLRLYRPAGLYASRISFCEVAVGSETRAQVDAAFAPFSLLEIDDETAWLASRVARELQGKGLHIGDNDVWIAATALRFGLPLVSNNTRHLGRVPGLDPRAY